MTRSVYNEPKSNTYPSYWDEPHTSVTALRTSVSMLACFDLPLTVNFIIITRLKKHNNNNNKTIIIIIIIIIRLKKHEKCKRM